MRHQGLSLKLRFSTRHAQKTISFPAACKLRNMFKIFFMLQHTKYCFIQMVRGVSSVQHKVLLYSPLHMRSTRTDSNVDSFEYSVGAFFVSVRWCSGDADPKILSAKQQNVKHVLKIYETCWGLFLCVCRTVWMQRLSVQ